MGLPTRGRRDGVHLLRRLHRPYPSLGEALARLAVGYNEREVEAILTNLKERMEGEGADTREGLG